MSEGLLEALVLGCGMHDESDGLFGVVAKETGRRDRSGSGELRRTNQMREARQVRVEGRVGVLLL